VPGPRPLSPRESDADGWGLRDHLPAGRERHGRGDPAAQKQLHPPGGRQCRSAGPAGFLRDPHDRAVSHRPGAGHRRKTERAGFAPRQQRRSGLRRGACGNLPPCRIPGPAHKRGDRRGRGGAP